MKIENLVVDTAAILKNVPLWNYGKDFHTVHEIINECKDAQSKQFLRSLHVELKLRQPLASTIRLVNEFSKKTGDSPNLSAADIKVIALTYDLEVEAKGSDTHLNKSPVEIKTKITTPYINGFNSNTDLGNETNENIEENGVDDPQSECKCCSDEFSIFDEDVFIAKISDLNEHLVSKSYMEGYVQTDEDFINFLKVEKYIDLIDIQSYFNSHPHFFRWFFHIAELFNDLDLNSKEYIENLVIDDTEAENSDTSNCLYVNSELKEESSSSIKNKASDDEIVNDEDWHTVSRKNKSSRNKKLGSSRRKENTVIENTEFEYDGWITPENIHKVFGTNITKTSDEDVDSIVHVACISADYAVQNVLKHLKLQTIGVDGKLISNLRTYILRCYACGATTDKMQRVFCFKCGHKTLKRVSVSTNPDGTKEIYINFKRRINLKGTNKPVPIMKGGKHPNNPLIVADQRFPQERMSKSGRKTTDALSEDYTSCKEYFAARDIYSRAGQLGLMEGRNQFRTKNRRKR